MRYLNNGTAHCLYYHYILCLNVNMIPINKCTDRRPSIFKVICNNIEINIKQLYKKQFIL